MAFYYLNLDKKNERNFPSKLKYMVIAKPQKPQPDNGKKRLSKAQLDDYNKLIAKYEKTIVALESGHVNMNNNKKETSDITKLLADILFNGINDTYRIFYINPIESETGWKDNKYYVSEFDVKKELNTPQEVIDQVIEDYDYFDVLGEIFEKGISKNEGYKEISLKWIKYLHEKIGNIFLEDIIKLPNYYYDGCFIRQFYDTKIAHDYAKELIDDGYVKLNHDTYCYYHTLVERLLRLGWTDYVLEVLKGDNMADGGLEQIRNRKTIINILSNLTKDENTKEIFSILGIKSNIFTLDVKENNYYARNVERKEFSEIGDLRSYLITQYHLPFEIASGNLDNLYNDDYEFEISTE